MTDRIRYATELRECLEGIVAENMGEYGVCHVVQENTRWLGTDDLYSELVEEWPLYSGNHRYPVPDPEALEADVDCYSASDYADRIYNDSSKEQMWDRTTSAYAELRWQLIEWLIEQCKEIENEV